MLNVANSTVINALVTNMINIFIFKYILDANDDILKKCRKKNPHYCELQHYSFHESQINWAVTINIQVASSNPFTAR